MQRLTERTPSMSEQHERKLELVIDDERECYTTLDFVMGSVKIPPDIPVESVTFSMLGKMSVPKSLFIDGNYKIVTVSWTFLHKDCYCSVSMVDPYFESVFAFRINSRLPSGTCPTGDWDHSALPPTIESAQHSHDVRRNVDVRYSIVAKLNYFDGSHEVIETPFKFMPRLAKYCYLHHPDMSDHQQDRRYVVREKMLSSFGAMLGDVESALTLPMHFLLSSDGKHLTMEVGLEIKWYGSRKRLPELRQASTSIKVFQHAEQYHHHRGDHRAPPLLLDTISLTKCDIPTFTSYPDHWEEIAPDTFLTKSSLLLEYTSEKMIEPSFESCLLSRSHKLCLKVGLHCPTLTIMKERTMTIEVPMSIMSTWPIGPDPCPSFLADWNGRLQGPTLQHDDLVEFWKSDSRKPEYGEALDTKIHPAPSRELPQYVPEAVDQDEAERVPAWLDKSQ